MKPHKPPKSSDVGSTNLARKARKQERYDHAAEAAIAGLRDGLGLGPSAAAIALARRFHEAYERLAPSFGYETRKDTRNFDPRTTNGRLMVAVCEEILRDSPAHKTEAWLR